jgi:hypothetical protein
MSSIFASIVNATYFLQIVEGSLLDSVDGMSINELINKAIAYAILGAGLLSVVFIFIGGISFILSGGDDEKVKQAISTIRYAIFGLIITILAVIIVNAVGQLIGLNAIEYIKFEEIVNVIQNISQDLQGNGGSSGGVRSLD